MKAIIAGGRNYKPTEKHLQSIIKILQDNSIDTIIEGGATGADEFGKWIAEKLHLNHIRFEAEWNNLNTNEPIVIKINKFGKDYNSLAGLNRNEKMAKEADICILLPGGRGTADMKDRALKHTLKIYEIS